MTGLIDFSVDPASNATSAPPINFQEGQPANTVNNSMRLVMAALACWREDNAGGLVAARGSNNAYTVSTAQGFSQIAADRAHTVSFTVSAANDGPATLSLDGRTARPLRRPGNIDLGPTDLSPDVIYRAVYSVVRASYIIVAPTIERPGRIDGFGSVAAIPPGWRVCNGEQVSRASFAALFAAIGVAHGAGNGTTTFNVPDGDGRAFFGFDNGKQRLTGAGGLVGAIGSVGGTEAVTLSAAQMPKHTHTASTNEVAGLPNGTTGPGGDHNHNGQTSGSGGHTHVASTDPAGDHQHGGATDPNGTHNHGVDYNTVAKVVTSNNDGTQTVVTSVGPDQAVQSGTEQGGNHAHAFTTSQAGQHAHPVVVAGVGDHAHLIGNSGTHTHSYPGVPAHSHVVTVGEAGNSDSHSNMPPGFVGVWAIKL